MKNILLLHPKLLFYKIRIYNKLSRYLKRHNFNLFIWAHGAQDCGDNVLFTLIEEEMTLSRLSKIIKDYQIDIIVNILSGLTNVQFYLGSIIISKLMSKKIVYYGHGIDLRYQQNRKIFWKYYFQNFVHLFFDRIILYGEREKSHLWKINQNKVNVANNTLLLKGYREITRKPKAVIKEKLNITEKHVILFCGRIEPRKSLDIIINLFLGSNYDMNDIALVVVGPNISDRENLLVRKADNVYYLGAVYDRYDLGEIFSVSDIFCIPGHMGLGIVEAFYWGKPVLTLDVVHAPEIGYLKQGVNGFILNTEEDLYRKIKEIVANNALYESLSREARNTYLKEASIKNMFDGFLYALESTEKNRTNKYYKP